MVCSRMGAGNRYKEPEALRRAGAKQTNTTGKMEAVHREKSQVEEFAMVQTELCEQGKAI